MPLTADQQARKDRLTTNGTLFAITGVIALASFGLTLGASLFAGLMFSCSLNSFAKASSIGRPAPAAGGRAPSGGLSFWDGFILSRLLRPSPRRGHVIGGGSVRRTTVGGGTSARRTGASFAGSRRVLPTEPPPARRTVVFGGPGRGAATPRSAAIPRSTSGIKLRR